MLTVDEAIDSILAGVRPNPSMRVPIGKALGLVLAEDVYADIDTPPFDNSAVDGFAVHAVDVRGASPDRPVVLHCVGTVAAGEVPGESVRAGTCVKVLTGAPVPDGADAMVMVEDTRADGDQIAVTDEAETGDHIRRRGGDVRASDKVLVAGTIVQAAEVAMLAAMGIVEPLCIQRPKVAVLSTGDELVDVDRKPGPGQIRDSNRYALAALVAEAGADLHSIRHVADTEADTEAALRAAAGLEGGEPADVIVTSGGVSVGERDYVKPALERLGTMDFWRVRMKPGKPLAVGRIGNSLFFGLPGNPVSTMVTFELFVRPALWKMAGRTEIDRPTVSAVLTDGLRHTPGRREFVRAIVTLDDGGYRAEPTGAQGSGILSSMLGANALVVVPEEIGDAPTGTILTALLIGPPRTKSAIRNPQSEIPNPKSKMESSTP